VENSSRILVAISHGYYAPWINIATEGQNETWLNADLPPNIEVLHYHGSPLGKLGLILDKVHERIRWSNRLGYFLLRLFDSVFTLPFLVFTPSASSSELMHLRHKTIHVHWPDSYLTFRWKAKGMFKYALSNYEFDFLFMTTSSSYIRLKELKKLLSQQNPVEFFGGASAYEGANFAAGSNRVLSRDLVQNLLDNPFDYLPFPIEDLSLSRSVLKKGVRLMRLPHLDVNSLENLSQVTDAELLNHYHFRLKSGSLENRNDVEIMKELHRRLLRIDNDS
jgi:hypothetical protein